MLFSKYVEKYGTTGRVTEDDIIWHMRFACWMNNDTGTSL